jgi:hypothetical protein
VKLLQKNSVLDNGDYHECDMQSFGCFCCTTFFGSRAVATAAHRDLPYAHLLQIGYCRRCRRKTAATVVQFLPAIPAGLPAEKLV